MVGDFVTLTCPTCGGKLQITPDIDRFACTHCGNEHLVKRSEGVIVIQPLAESLRGLMRATDRTASEMALRRLGDELARHQSARSEAQDRVDGCQKALHERDDARRKVLWEAIVLVPLTILAFLWPLPLQLAGEIGSLREARPVDLAVWLVPPLLVALAAGLAIRHALAAPALKVRREQIEADLAAARDSLRSVEESISGLAAEQMHHRGRVALRE